MSLEKIFKKKVEKADNENCIKVINSEVKILDVFSVYKYLLRKFKPGNFYIMNLTRWREEMLKYLSNYRPKQEEVETLYEKINSYENKHRAFNGVFLTAVVQHMFNSGEKKIKLKNIDADFFGFSLEGKAKERLSLEIERLEGNFCFWYCENCDVKIGKFFGSNSFCSFKNCKFDGEFLGFWNFTC